MSGALSPITTTGKRCVRIGSKPSATALSPLLPVFLKYVLSFIYIGIYWNNHHHMLHATRHVTGEALWANLHLLFWLSLLPFVTGWMGESHFTPLPLPGAPWGSLSNSRRKLRCAGPMAPALHIASYREWVPVPAGRSCEFAICS